MSEEIYHRITGQTELLGLIAEPIRHSQSPRMHNLAISKLGLNYAYLAFEVNNDELKSAVDGLKALKVRGWNVSMPNKMPIIELLDEVSDAVKLVGACNTVVNDNGKLTGHITDGIGQMEALREHGIEPKGAVITLIGAGGAATAIAVQAALEGAKEIKIFNRRDAFWAIGEETVAKIQEHTSTTVSLNDIEDVALFEAAVAESVVLINGTAVGMGNLKGISPLPTESVLRKDLFVSDVVYSPAKSRFLEQAEAAGCRYTNGIPMMFYQGAAAFKLWTGQDMPLDYVREHMEF